ncbi:glycosyltransferase [Paraglaciecola sp.]|uniref:glycosyltransferase n=1 Tax=Paraglaciecola sp. TaxID=1920173 RepID=UPI00273D7ADC|nr:glycosyltransferase [Paraglaciecola sp.]MDP5030981.1 glycosyltransferase [Paraglaciecola sp.]
MSKIKVMHLTYDMRIGGTEMVIKNIIESCDTEKFVMSIFCIEKPIGPWGLDLQSSGIQISAKSRKPGFDTSLITFIRKHLKQNNIDVIHCHQYTPWVYGVLAAFGLKTKVIFTEHGRFYPDSSSWKRKLVNPWLCKITDHITSISKATKQALIDFENIPKDQIQVIYNGIKPLAYSENEVTLLKQKFKISENAKILGTVARLDPIKNQCMMVEAFSIVLRKFPSTYLFIVGDGDERQKLENLVDTLQIRKNVIFTGYIFKPANYIAMMDIFLLSSLSEGTSMTLLEAMSLGKPSVVTDAGGNSEIIINRLNGFTTENDNSAAFADAIEAILNKHDLNEFQHEAYRIFNSYFSIDLCLGHYSKLYENL